MEIHIYLNFAIATLKTSRQAASNDPRVKGRKPIFEGVGERLEALLAACANLGSRADSITSQMDDSSANPIQMPDQLAQLDARLQQMAEFTSWPPDESESQSDWLALNDVDWQQVLRNLS